jgi:phosphoribosylformylglycinamidine synthase
MDAIVEASGRGVPVLGICNGAQILVESGIVPDFDEGKIDVALAPNKMTGRHGYYCNWVYLGKGPARCLFTDFMTDDSQPALPIPFAHAEGRFVTSSDTVRARLEAGEGVAVAYTSATGARAGSYPDNPNGSMFGIAGLTNPAGNVLAIMPHPERAAWAHQVPRRVGGVWAQARGRLTREELFAPGPGRGFFTSLKKALI